MFLSLKLLSINTSSPIIFNDFNKFKMDMLNTYSSDYKDSLTITEKVIDEKKPYASPDFDLVLKEDSQLMIFIFDQDQNFVRPIVIKTLEKGRYLIYSRIFQKFNTKFPFFYELIVINDSYSYKKKILMK